MAHAAASAKETRLGRWGRLVVRHRLLALFLPVLLCLVTAPLALDATDRLSTAGWLPAHAESENVVAILRDEFGRNTTSHYLLFRDPTGQLAATDDAFRQEVARTVAPLHRDPDVITIYTWGSTDNDILNRTLLSDDTSMSLAVIVMRTSEDGTNSFGRVSKQIHSERLDVKIGGWPATAHAFAAMTRDDLLRAEQIAIPVTLLLLVLVFGGVLAAALPIGLALLALLPTLALIATMSRLTETSLFAVNTVSMLGLALGIDYALIMVSRFREELARHDVETAMSRAMATAGETILVSGTAVLVGLVGLLTFAVPAATSTALAAIAIVLICMLLAVTALPAALALLGHRLLARRWRIPAPRIALPSLARLHPAIATALALMVIGVLTVPAFGMRGAASSMTILPQSEEARQVYDTVDTSFSSTTLTPIVVIVTPRSGSMTSPANLNALLAFQNTLNDLDGVRSTQSLWDFLPVGVTPTLVSTSLLLDATIDTAIRPFVTPSAAMIEIAPEHGPGDHRSLDLVRILRTDGYALSEGAFDVQVGAEIGTNVDLVDYVKQRAPLTVAVVIVLTWLALFARFRSVLLPTKAIVLNLLSLGASFGMLVWIFQEGHLHRWLGFEPLGYTILLVPIVMFCFMFGLSMDYEVMMLSRIKEVWDRTGDNDRAVREGLDASARLVTRAALIMLVVFIAFGTTELQFIKQIGVGLGLAVLIDTTLIRLVLLPSSMRLLGRWNWWMPGRKG